MSLLYGSTRVQYGCRILARKAKSSHVLKLREPHGGFSPIFASSACPSAQLDLRVHNVGLDMN